MEPIVCRSVQRVVGPAAGSVVSTSIGDGPAVVFVTAGWSAVEVDPTGPAAELVTAHWTFLNSCRSILPVMSIAQHADMTFCITFLTRLGRDWDVALFALSLLLSWRSHLSLTLFP